MKLTPIHTAESAVAELKLTVKNKSLGAPYTRLGYVTGQQNVLCSISSSFTESLVKKEKLPWLDINVYSALQ